MGLYLLFFQDSTLNILNGFTFSTDHCEKLFGVVLQNIVNLDFQVIFQGFANFAKMAERQVLQATKLRDMANYISISGECGQSKCQSTSIGTHNYQSS